MRSWTNETDASDINSMTATISRPNEHTFDYLPGFLVNNKTDIQMKDVALMYVVQS